MIIIGLDPGIARTGFGVVDTSRPHAFVRCGCITTPEELAEEDRLALLSSDLTSLLQDVRPAQSVVEQIFFGTNVSTAMRTAQARGVILCTLRQFHIPVTTLTPLQIKSRLTGYGNASKHQVQSVLMRRLKLSHLPEPDDAADALAAAVCVADEPAVHFS